MVVLSAPSKLLFASYGCPCLTEEPWLVRRIIDPANWFLLLLIGCLLRLRLSFAAWHICSVPLSQWLTMNDRFTSQRQLGQKVLQHSSHAYDKQLLFKVGGLNTHTRTTVPQLSSSAQDLATKTHTSLHQLNGQLKPLSVPAISPGYNGFRSPVFDSGSAESHRARYGSISTPGPLGKVPSQHRESYEHNMFSDNEFGIRENRMRELKINDRSPAELDDYLSGPKGRQKRRASSPPPKAARDDRLTTSDHGQLYHRRSSQMPISRNCNAPLLQSNPSSLSSAGSASQRNDSIGSSFGFSSTAASSITSNGRYQRLSPNALSPLGGTDFSPASPYAAKRTLDPQIRQMSESMSQSQQNSISSHIPGVYICECCPKKPKKFESEEELR
jgi:hypothetical protein